MAAELLAPRAGQRALLEFYALMQPGTSWQMAFEAAFSMTVTEFYELFEEHRAAGLPQLDVPLIKPLFLRDDCATSPPE